MGAQSLAVQLFTEPGVRLGGAVDLRSGHGQSEAPVGKRLRRRQKVITHHPPRVGERPTCGVGRSRSCECGLYTHSLHPILAPGLLLSVAAGTVVAACRAAIGRGAFG